MKYDNSSDRKKKERKRKESENLRDTTIVRYLMIIVGYREYKVFFPQRHINDR